MKTNYFYILLKKSITFAILIAIFLSNKNMAQEILNGHSSFVEISVNGEIDNSGVYSVVVKESSVDVPASSVTFEISLSYSFFLFRKG